MTVAGPNLPYAIYTWTVLAVIVWIVSTGLARARAFRPFRRWVKSKSDYFGEGVSCQFCLSHWVGFLVVGVSNPHFLPGELTTGFLPHFFGHSFAVIGLAALIARTIGQTPPNGVPHPDEVEEVTYTNKNYVGEVYVSEEESAA